MCLICERIELIKQGRNPHFVKELEKLGYNLVFDLGGIQDYKGEIEK